MDLARGAGAGARFLLRRAVDGDARAAAEVWLRSYDAALPSVRRAHDDDGVRAWFRHVVVPDCETWVAADEESGDGALAGVMVLDEAGIDQLYLAPERRGLGLGDLFVAKAKELRPGGLELWTFQVNESAHRFYRRHGFTEAERTDGTRNEEREPDVRFVWRP
ncbi:GNAT family N-acetyltransferase [Streptomyces sp. NPDC004111]|uniref:GNAT family N-acetyltransferase n=1 Tax=Streptomyces sp. NPDC004111 TaxID=3364690 RepID=UPI0036927CE9